MVKLFHIQTNFKKNYILIFYTLKFLNFDYTLFLTNRILINTIILEHLQFITN